MEIEKKWWKEEVIYQIYPRSFQDSNGDGIGDIKGIISRLDYLQSLGVDIIWLGPVYQSPNDDNGYDISDYYSIHPEFGTMADFDELLKGLKDRNMKLIMDLVVNHTSDEHQWFKDSRSSEESPYRDFYFWRKAKNGRPPNNWLSFFGGPAWKYDSTTDSYYLHLFTEKQPDLNWENPQVRKEIDNIMNFWLERGIDGFRMDVISLISKRLPFEEAEFTGFGDLVQRYYANGPRVHEYINDMYNNVLGRYDIMTVGEGPGITSEKGLDYVGHDRKELSMIFHLDHMFLGFGPKGRFDPVPYNWNDIKRIFREWHDAMGESGWVSIFLDNHDFPRMVSRFGNDTAYRVESAKLLAMLILTMKGTPCIYQGSEIGMTNMSFQSIKECRDVETLNFHDKFTAEGMSEEAFLNLANSYGRDNVRTPVQWDAAPFGGFSQKQPWINVNPNYKDINVEAAMGDVHSVYWFYRELLRLRKESKVLQYGEWKEYEPSSPDLYIYTRRLDDREMRVVLNHTDREIGLDSQMIEGYNYIFGNYEGRSEMVMHPWECRLYTN